MRKSASFFGIFLALFVGVLDAALKYWALKRLPEQGVVSFPIDVILHKNEGIAFNIPIPLFIVVLFTLAILITLVTFAFRWWKTRPGRSVAAIVIVIGALGNLVDRLINQFTTDYIVLLGRSVINLSDILIVVGTLLLFFYTERRIQGRKTV